MLIPSQIRSAKPLVVRESADGIYSFVNAYDGNSQDFFDNHQAAEGNHPRDASRQEIVEPAVEPESPERTGKLQREPIQGSESELWAKIEHYLFHIVDPEKEARARDVKAVYEELKHSGSLCVSQIAIETGLPLEKIFLALRQLLREGAVEWRPDRSGMVSIKRAWARMFRRRHQEPVAGSDPQSDPVYLIETAWSLKRFSSGNSLDSSPRQPT
jgi:hypothetical protein